MGVNRKYSVYKRLIIGLYWVKRMLLERLRRDSAESLGQSPKPPPATLRVAYLARQEPPVEIKDGRAANHCPTQDHNLQIDSY